MERDERIRARRMWLDGRSTEPEIAKALEVDVETVARWRDDESWAELRDIIDARVAARRDAGVDADARTIIICDALDNLAAKLTQRGATSMTARDLKTCAEVLRITEQVRARARTAMEHRKREKK